MFEGKFFSIRPFMKEFSKTANIVLKIKKMLQSEIFLIINVDLKDDRVSKDFLQEHYASLFNLIRNNLGSGRKPLADAF